jgi:hypothetical protein
VQGGDSSSDGEDDDEGLIDERTQAQIFETLLKIRRRDQSIYDAQAKFYSSDSEEDEEEAAAAAGEGGAAGEADRGQECERLNRLCVQRTKDCWAAPLLAQSGRRMAARQLLQL